MVARRPTAFGLAMYMQLLTAALLLLDRLMSSSLTLKDSASSVLDRCHNYHPLWPSDLCVDLSLPDDSVAFMDAPMGELQYSKPVWSYNGLWNRMLVSPIRRSETGEG